MMLAGGSKHFLFCTEKYCLWLRITEDISTLTSSPQNCGNPSTTSLVGKNWGYYPSITHSQKHARSYLIKCGFSPESSALSRKIHCILLNCNNHGLGVDLLTTQPNYTVHAAKLTCWLHTSSALVQLPCTTCHAADALDFGIMPRLTRFSFNALLQRMLYNILRPLPRLWLCWLLRSS